MKLEVRRHPSLMLWHSDLPTHGKPLEDVVPVLQAVGTQVHNSLQQVFKVRQRHIACIAVPPVHESVSRIECIGYAFPIRDYFGERHPGPK